MPAPAVTGLIDWSGLSATFQTRGLTLGTGDQEVIVEHWKRWYPVAQALYRLPLASTFFDSPAGIMNSLSSTMVDTTLAGDHPNPIERFNLEAERFGVSTTTVSLPALHF